MLKKENKKIKLILQKEIKNNFNYLIFCRYNDITSKQLFSYKILLKHHNIKLKYIKNTLNPLKTDLVKNKGPLVMVYFNTFIQLKKFHIFLNREKNLQFMYLVYMKTKIYTNYKTESLLNTNALPLELAHPLLNFYRTILQINQSSAGIT